MTILMLFAAMTLNPSKEIVATHANLAIYPIYESNRTANANEYISLDEGLKAGTVVVTEKGDGGSALIRNQNQVRTGGFNPQPQRQGSSGTVNTLWLTNKSGKKLLLLSGEIVSGGKQDRIVQQDTLVRPSKEPINLSVFCVEHGRWDQKSTNFAPAGAGGMGGLADPSLRGRAQHEKNQQAVWNQVDNSLTKLKTENGTKTYQANLNSTTVQKSVDAYVKAIQSQMPLDKIAGVAVAINGKLVWMDRFASQQLFRKYWAKMVKSYALEAMQAMERTPSPKPPTYDEAMRYAIAREGKMTHEAEDGVWKLTKIEAKTHVIYELEDEAVKPPVILHASKMAVGNK